MTEQAHGESEASRRILRGLLVALVLAVVVLGFEAIGAILSRSLAVTVDAVHDIPDIFAFAISYFALAGTARGRTDAHTFGSHRLEVFAAILNAFIILAAGVVFAYPAILELVSRTTLLGPIDPAWILFAAVPTLALRSASAVYLGRIPRAARDLNIRSVLVHLGTDIAITAALIADAAILVLSPGSAWVDGAVTLVVAAILIYESIPIFQGGWEVLTERVPRGVSLPAVTESILTAPRVRGVHDVHIWAVCPTLVCMTAHVRVDNMPMHEASEVTAELRERVERAFGIVHSVFELETEPSTPEDAPSTATG
ncbi:MAG: cation transporter [Thermoplasmata archaeon]|nr:cation transporter [Thermoplasmata archaeon]